jgi:hypothetical protein
MRYLCFVACVFTFASPSFAQHSPSLPPIGGPLPPIGITQRVPSWERPRTPSWERPHTPSWEKPQIPWWEKGHVARPESRPPVHRGRNRQPQVIYIYQPYPVEVQPQVIVVERPVERIVEVEVPVERIVTAPLPPQEPEPPFVPSGSRVLYVIPGCYVGNVSPMNLKLPATCDLSKLTTFTP